MINIFIADDSETFRNTLFQDLSEEGFEVSQAQDGLDAIKKIRELKGIDLLIIDVNMPGFSGLEVLEMAKNEGVLDNKVIFMLTTDSNADLKAKGKSLGVKAWITKPYKKETLIMAIKKVFGL